MRTKKSLINSIVSMVMNIIVIIAGLITQSIFAKSLGLEYLGINGLFTSIITMLGVIELGLGSAIIYHLYSPLAKKNKARLRSLMHFYKKGYRYIALTVAMLGLIIMPFLSTIVGNVSINESIQFIFVLFLVDIVCSYLLTYKRSLLYADQKSYVVNLTHIISIIVLNIAQIAILLITKNFYLYLVAKILMRITENIILTYIVNKQYPFLNRNSKPIDKETRLDILKKIKGLMFHKVGAFVVTGSDSIVISIFLGVKTVGLYSNYYLIISALITVIYQAFASMTASVGNLLVENSPGKTFDIYKKSRFVNFWLACVISIGFLIVSGPFVKIWLGESYILEFGVVITLTINLFLQIMRSTIASFKEAAGIFHEDRFVPLIESITNIILSIALLHIFGLAGVFIGTICSNLVLHLYSYPHFVYVRLFKKGYATYYKEFATYCIVAIIIGAITYSVSRLLSTTNDLMYFVLGTIISIAIPNFLLFILYRNNEEFIYFIKLISKTETVLKRCIRLS